MNSNCINSYQENEIDKILQDGIDKSLLYIQSLNMNNSNPFPKYSTIPKNKSKSKNILDKNKTNSFLKNNSTKNMRSLSITQKNDKNKKLSLKTKQKSNNKIKKVNKKIIFDYHLEQNQKKEEVEKYQKQLIQERIKQNKFQKEMNSKRRKEEEFNKIEENNIAIKNNTEELLSKLKRSEKIREEQSKIIEGLLKEYNSKIKELRNNPDVEIINKFREIESEVEILKEEGGKKIAKKKKKK